VCVLTPPPEATKTAATVRKGHHASVASQLRLLVLAPAGQPPARAPKRKVGSSLLFGVAVAILPSWIIILVH
jgi:hypothetical protein